MIRRLFLAGVAAAAFWLGWTGSITQHGHPLLAAGMLGLAAGIFLLSWSCSTMWREWRDDKALRAAEARYERHTHRKGDALPVAGRIPLDRLADPTPLPGEPPWLFAGESEQGWASESAEYELLTQTAVQPASSVEGEPPIDTGELLAITDRVESWIAQWTAQGNIDRHTIQASDG